MWYRQLKRINATCLLAIRNIMIQSIKEETCLKGHLFTTTEQRQVDHVNLIIIIMGCLGCTHYMYLITVDRCSGLERIRAGDRNKESTKHGLMQRTEHMHTYDKHAMPCVPSSSYIRPCFVDSLFPVTKTTYITSR